MTTSQIPFTAHSDDAPSVDANGDPRFVTERDMAEADLDNLWTDDEAAIQYEADYRIHLEEQNMRGGYWFP